MTQRRLLSIALALATTGSAFAATGDFSRTLTVNGAPTITVVTGSGYIHVTSGAQSEVRVAAKVSTEHGWSFTSHGSDSDRVQAVTARPPIVQNGNSIMIGPQDSDSAQFRNIQIDYDIVLPASTTLKVVSGSGDIEASNVASLIYAQTGSGDIHLNNIGAAPHVGTGSGSIRALGVHGSANLETGSGEIELRQDAAGDVKAQTGSGSVRLHGVSGSIRAGTGSGDVEIDGNPTSEWKVDSGSGSVRLSIASTAPFTLNASTSSGTINVSGPIALQAGLDKQHLVGSVRGGGPTVRINTSSGDITIR